MFFNARPVLGLLAGALMIGACGGSGSASGSARSVNSQRPSVEYVVRLSGSSESPRTSGTGYAIVALHDRVHEICYRFAHLHRFVRATDAHIHRGAVSHTGPIVLGLSVGRRLHHHGCVAAGAVLMSSIAAHPSDYYVEIQSVTNPNGAVRSQL